MTVTPVDMQGIIAHRTQVDGMDVLRGGRGHYLEGIGWRLLLLSPQLATGGTRAYLTQIAIGIEALVPIIPEDTHLTLIVPLDLHRVERFTGVSHRKPLAPVQALSQREGAPLNWRPSADAVAGNGGPLSWAPSTDAPLKQLPGSQRQVF